MLHHTGNRSLALAGQGRIHKLGYFSLKPDQAEADLSHTVPIESPVDLPEVWLSDMCVLESLAEDELHDIDCIVADIRINPRRVLCQCRLAAKAVPVIVLCYDDQHFSDDYPFGTFVSDMTTASELGKSIFWQRVKRAIEKYDKPVSLSEVDNPVYRVFKSIADQTSDWILIKDLQHRFVVVGEHFANAVGAPVDQIIGRDDLEIGSSEVEVRGDAAAGKPGFWAQDDVVTSSGRVSVEENPEWVLYSTSARYRRTYRVPLKNSSGEVYALLVCSQDITEQVSNERLLGERTIMLEQVTDEKQRAEAHRVIAEEAVAARTRFLAAASHDLRQPLHAIGLFLHSLDKRIEGREERDLVKQIKLSCTSLSTLFNSCLDISRLDAGVVERKFEHFHASTFLENLHEEFRRQAIEKGLDYRLSVDSSIILSDEILLSRIIRNLLSNALQNTEKGHLSVECRNAGASIELKIADSGCGIAGEELQRIFNEYHQIHVGNERPGQGLGLGLAIVKRLCELLNISITLKSQLEKGACFTLSIPAGDQSYLRTVDTVAPVTLPENLLVIIVEDDQYIRHGMQVLLESYGCHTICAGDVESVCKMLDNTPELPHIIIADYHLSGGATGTQAIRDLRIHLKKRIPALLVTGDTSTDSEREAVNSDLLMLHKPVSSEALIEAINGEVRSAGALRKELDEFLV